MKSLKFIIPILLAIFFGWLTFSKLPISEIIPYFKSANYSWILLGVVCGLLSHLSRAYRWQYMLKPMGHSIKLHNSIMALFINYLANYGIPRSGEVLRAAVATNYEGVPFEKSFGTIVSERVIDLVVILGICGLTLFFQFNFVINLLTENFNLSKLLLLAVLVLIVFIILVLYIKKSKNNFALKIKNFISGLIEGITSVFKMKDKLKYILHTIFIWGMYILMFYITTFALIDLKDVPFSAIIVAFLAASFTIAATNGGVFFYPAAVLASFSLYGIPEEPSFAFGWIVWTSQTLMIIIIGILSFIFLPIMNKKGSMKS